MKLTDEALVEALSGATLSQLDAIGGEAARVLYCGLARDFLAAVPEGEREAVLWDRAGALANRTLHEADLIRFLDVSPHETALLERIGKAGREAMEAGQFG